MLDSDKRKEASDKRKNTLILKYGVDHVSKIPSVIEKKRETCIRKYGSASTLHLDVVKNARINSLELNKKEINQKRSAAWDEELIKKTNASRIETLTKKYGVSNSSQIAEVKKIV